MARIRPEAFFDNPKRQRRLLSVTVILFICLALETLFSGITAIYDNGGTSLDFHLKPTKVFCILIYLAMALLLYKRVDYKYLLIPDFFLFGIKLYYAVSGIISLNALSTVGTYTTLTEWESVVENGLFCIFLLTLFACKLLPSRESMHLRLPYICLWALILCFPFTVMFEGIGAVNEAVLHTLTFKGALFNFLMGVLNEAVLDLPYALLLMVIFFVPDSKK